MSELILSRAESRKIDVIAVEQCGIPSVVLMENAGRGVVDCLEKFGLTPKPNAVCDVLICCGKGNNAGDGFVIARHLTIRGFSPVVWLFASPRELTGDAATNYRILTRCGVPVCVFDGQTWDDFDRALQNADWIVDALLGTGAEGGPREPFAEVIRRINAAVNAAEKKAEKKNVLAVDLPSGLDADTGMPHQPTVRATHTCTFFAKKQGFLKPEAIPVLGLLHVLDIGLPHTLTVPTHQ
ncbi:MAG: NAD(P)H-hydrate epimerase [Planctomycetaceae bacterium]|nr:NAD(P)H-hydrate epimerase [Planctomycetaceae bacterium]